MPDPFTEDTLEGRPQTFEQFALHTALLLPMFHDLGDGPLPEKFVPNDHHKKEFNQAQERLVMLEQLDDDGWNRRAEAAYEQDVQERKAYLQKIAEQRARAEARMAEVRAWQPPTPGHERLKEVMLEQLNVMLELSRDASSYFYEPIRSTGQELKKRELADTQHDIKCYGEYYRQEVEFATQRTAWVKALRESLSPSEPTTSETE